MDAMLVSRYARAPDRMPPEALTTNGRLPYDEGKLALTQNAPSTNTTLPAFEVSKVPPKRTMRFRPDRVTFGRHESFPLRFGWVAKGLDALQRDPAIFSREDATVELGVGKNMVSSMRYWLQAAQLVRPLSQGRGYAETELARTAFGEEGDPFFEDDATIWLIHWLLASNPTGATAIYWFFNHFHKPAFTAEEVSAALSGYVRREATTRTSPTTLARDVTMLLRMYTRTTSSSRLALEDALDSPLSLLDLIDRVDAHHRRCALASRSDLPLPVFAFAIADVFNQLDSAQVAIQDLMYSDMNHCAPGAVFRMTEEGLVHKIEELRDASPSDFRLDRSAGMYQLYNLRPADPPGHIRGRHNRLAAA